MDFIGEILLNVLGFCLSFLPSLIYMFYKAYKIGKLQKELNIGFEKIDNWNKDEFKTKFEAIDSFYKHESNVHNLFEEQKIFKRKTSLSNLVREPENINLIAQALIPTFLGVIISEFYLKSVSSGNKIWDAITTIVIINMIYFLVLHFVFKFLKGNSSEEIALAEYELKLIDKYFERHIKGNFPKFNNAKPQKAVANSVTALFVKTMA